MYGGHLQKLCTPEMSVVFVLVKVKVDFVQLAGLRRFNYVMILSSIASVRGCDHRGLFITKDGAHGSAPPCHHVFCHLKNRLYV